MTNKTYYCTEDDVRREIGLDSSDVSDVDILEFIKMSEDEVDTITHTTFLKVQSDGTATSATTATIADTNQSWTANEWNSDANKVGGYMVYVYSGTGNGQARVITDSTTSSLTISPDWETTPSTDSLYRIFKNTYEDETFTGDGTQTYFTKEYPLLNLYSITIDSTDVTPSNIYQTNQWGKLHLGSSSEVTYWKDTYPLLCNIKYFYGVYPVPLLVRDLTAVLAAIRCASYMIGGTYTFATSYSIPDLSVTKGVPYPHFNTALEKLTKRRDWLVDQIINRITRPMFA